MAQEAHSRTVYRRPPCPSYDVEGTEAWLTDLAREGLLLEADGFFAGFAAFEKTAPTRVKYRLEAAQKHASLWSEDGGEPDEAQVELCAQYRWEYVARHGQFYIYRSDDPSARELNTDPKVQALALNAVKKRLVSDLISLLVWTVLYPLLFLRAGLFTTILGLGTWRFALLTVLVLWEIVRSVRALTVLGRFQKKLRQGLTPAHTKNWRQGAARYHAANALRLLLALALAVCLLHVWSDRIMDTGLVPLDEYDGKLPFATMRELAAFDGAAVTARRETMRGLRFNSVEDHSDWLAPRCISYHEVADFSRSDGTALRGGLYIDYVEAAAPWLAHRLLQERWRYDRAQEHYRLLDAPALEADEAVAYESTLHFPTVLIRRGNVFLRAYFYQFDDPGSVTLPPDTWCALLAQSLPAS